MNGKLKTRGFKTNQTTNKGNQMKTQITDSHIKIWLSANDTYEWANRPGESWPCSSISGNRLFAEFDKNGLLDLQVNGGYPEDILPSDEFNAITSDFIKTRIDQNHPLYFITVGQFNH
jgi:hypothetical protein